MAITAALVRELREETGSGMMDCKKALVATNGDKEAAIEWLRKKGLATAEKKSGRIASEGLSMIVLSEDAKKGVAVEVNSETDFVAQNEKFRNYVKTVADQALDTKAADIDAFLAETSKADPTKTVAEYNASMIAVIGENLKIRRFQQLEEQNGFVTGYTHMNGKIVVLVDVESDVDNEAVREMGKNIAMQIAALNPKYTSDAEVPQDYKDHEIAILTEQTKNDPKMAGKPEKVISGAVMGRLKKELKDCLIRSMSRRRTVSSLLHSMSLQWRRLRTQRSTSRALSVSRPAKDWRRRTRTSQQRLLHSFRSNNCIVRT